MMTRRYPSINPKYQAFLAEKEETESENMLSQTP